MRVFWINDKFDDALFKLFGEARTTFYAIIKLWAKFHLFVHISFANKTVLLAIIYFVKHSENALETQLFSNY